MQVFYVFMLLSSRHLNTQFSCQQTEKAVTIMYMSFGKL